MTTTLTTAVPLDGQQAAARVDATAQASVVPVTKAWRGGFRTVGYRHATRYAAARGERAAMSA